MSEMDLDISNCCEALFKGGLILYPTDTIWGIGADASSDHAVEKVFQLKKRKDEKSLIVLVSDQKDVYQLVEKPDPGIFEYLHEINRPTTVVYTGAKNLAPSLIQDGTIAIRICRDEFCNQLIRRFGKPLVSTSANISEYPSPRSFSEISDDIKDGVDYVVEYRQRDINPAVPSQIIRWNDGNPVAIRS